MNTVEKIKLICSQRKIAISRLERECGFANGYIRSLRSGVIPSDRLQIVADYLDVPVTYLLDVQSDVHEGGYYVDGETAAIAQKVFDDPNLRILFSAADDVAPENILLAAEMLRRFKQTNPDG